MHVISRKRLVKFWIRHPDAEQPLRAWYAQAKKAKWMTPHEIKAIHHNASILPKDRVVFNIKGNNYRIVVVVQYKKGVLLIRFVGTHEEYDRIEGLWELP
jgi:mRNA interferase HigB